LAGKAMDIKDRGEILGNAVNTILSRNRGEARSEKTLVPDSSFIH